MCGVFGAGKFLIYCGVLLDVHRRSIVHGVKPTGFCKEDFLSNNLRSFVFPTIFSIVLIYQMLCNVLSSVNIDLLAVDYTTVAIYDLTFRKPLDIEVIDFSDV